MKTRNILGLLLAVLALPVLACGLSVKDGKLSVPVTLNESTLKSLVNNVQSVASGSGMDLSVEVDDLDFKAPDTITASGTFTTDSGQAINGSLDMKFSVEDGKPKVVVTGTNIPGLDTTSDVVKKINDTLSQLLNDQIEASGQSGAVKSIEVTDDSLVITLEVDLQSK